MDEGGLRWAAGWCRHTPQTRCRACAASHVVRGKHAQESGLRSQAAAVGVPA